MISTILAKNENVNWNLKNVHKETPLMQAIKDGHEERVKIILTNPKIDLSSQDRNGWTALFWALKKDRCAIVDMLLNMTGVDFNIKTNAMEGYATVASDVRKHFQICFSTVKSSP